MTLLTLSWLDKKTGADERLVPPGAAPERAALACPVCRQSPSECRGVQVGPTYILDCHCRMGHPWLIVFRATDVDLHAAQAALKDSREQLKRIKRRDVQILRAYTGGQYDREGEDDAAALARFKEDHEPVKAEQERLDRECDRLLAEVKRLKQAVKAAGKPRLRYSATERLVASEAMK